MNSRVFKNILEESNESEANFNLAIAILKFAEDSFDSGRTFFKDEGIHQWTKRSLGHWKKILRKSRFLRGEILYRFGEKILFFYPEPFVPFSKFSFLC